MLTIKDLFSTEELKQYQETVYPFSLSIIHTALKAKLEEDPDYEVWVPLVYYRLSRVVKDGKPGLINPYKLFISNKGNLRSLRYKDPRDITGVVITDSGYAAVDITFNKCIVRILIHRALACCFIPLKDEHGIALPQDLEVNHINGIKTDFEMNNLEWATSQENVLHAYETGLSTVGIDRATTIPIKGKVLVGEHKGYEFLLYGVRECWSYGFQQPNVSLCIAGKNKSHRNCAWAFATEEEVSVLPRGISTEIMESLLSINPLLKKCG